MWSYQLQQSGIPGVMEIQFADPRNTLIIPALHESEDQDGARNSHIQINSYYLTPRGLVTFLECPLREVVETVPRDLLADFRRVIQFGGEKIMEMGSQMQDDYSRKKAGRPSEEESRLFRIRQGESAQLFYTRLTSAARLSTAVDMDAEALQEIYQLLRPLSSA